MDSTPDERQPHHQQEISEDAPYQTGFDDVHHDRCSLTVRTGLVGCPDCESRDNQLGSIAEGGVEQSANRLRGSQGDILSSEPHQEGERHYRHHRGEEGGCLVM